MPPYVSASMEVLQTLEFQNTLSGLEARLDSLEIDIARQSGTRDDDARRIAGEMAVMKARVEDALNAFAATAEDLREMSNAVEKRLGEIGGGPAADVDARAVLEAGIQGVMGGVGDALGSLTASVSARIEELGSRMQVVQDAVVSMVRVVENLAPIPQRLADLEAKLAARGE